MRTPPVAPVPRGTARMYVVGFLFSLMLTFDAYLIVTKGVLAGPKLVAAIVALAIIQLFVQLVCFLHLGREARPQWNTLVFGFMAIVLLILVLGSLWIMNNLNYHMSPQQMIKYLNDQGGGF